MFLGKRLYGREKRWISLSDPRGMMKALKGEQVVGTDPWGSYELSVIQDPIHRLTLQRAH
jgi:hypothetical protein